MRAVDTARLVWGGSQLTATDHVCSLVLRRPPAPVERAVTRLLGARNLAQLLGARTGPSWASRLLLGPRVDQLHAISMVLVAVSSRRYRRSALVSAVVASAFAVATATPARQRFSTIEGVRPDDQD